MEINETKAELIRLKRLKKDSSLVSLRFSHQFLIAVPLLPMIFILFKIREDKMAIPDNATSENSSPRSRFFLRFADFCFLKALRSVGMHANVFGHV